MRILQINSTVGVGSTGRIAEDIGKILINHNHESYIAYGRSAAKSISKLIRIGNQKDIILHGAKTLAFDRHGFGSSGATKMLLKTIELIRPDIVHLHNLHGYYINIDHLFGFLKATKSTVVWTLHDCWPFTGHCSHYQDISCNKWKTQCYLCPKTSKYPASYFIDASKKNYDDKRSIFNRIPKNKLSIVTPSKWLANETRQSFLSDYLVKIIPNGIDLKIFFPMVDDSLKVHHGISQRRVILGVANSWQKSKGLEDFYRLSKVLNREFIIVLIGLSASQIKDLPDLILGITKTNSLEELRNWYSCADVFINPTYLDNFPTTNIEALACGTPVITYDTGGSPEAIDKFTGKVVERGNIRGLVSAINEFAVLPREQLRDTCRNRAIELFNSTDRYHDYLNLYSAKLHN